MRLYEFFVPLTENAREKSQKLVGLISQPPNGWQVESTNNFNKSFKKYKKDERVLQGLLDLVEFIVNNEQAPDPRGYPVSLNVHQIVRSWDDRYSNSLTSHLKGQKIIALFRVQGKNLTLLNMGTHQDFGWK